MLKGDNSVAPYLNLTNNAGPGAIQCGPSSKSSGGGGGSSSQSAIKQESAFSALACAAAAAGTAASNGQQQQKVTRRVAHEICEKRKLEEQESELNKRVKTEGDVNEAVIKQLVKQVEQEYANNENDVSPCRHGRHVRFGRLALHALCKDRHGSQHDC